MCNEGACAGPVRFGSFLLGSSLVFLAMACSGAASSGTSKPRDDLSADSGIGVPTGGDGGGVAGETGSGSLAAGGAAESVGSAGAGGVVENGGSRGVSGGGSASSGGLTDGGSANGAAGGAAGSGQVGASGGAGILGSGGVPGVVGGGGSTGASGGAEKLGSGGVSGSGSLGGATGGLGGGGSTGASSTIGVVNSGGIAGGGVSGSSTAVAGAGGSAGAGGAGSPSGQLYVINAGSNRDNAILRFAGPATVNGDVAPAAKISGPASTLRCAHFGYLNVPRDRMYVADPCPPAGVDVFDNISTLNGAVAPSRRISGSNTTLAVGTLVGNDTMMTVALDAVRDILYVSTAKQDNSVAEVAVFANASTATGNIAPTHIITTPPIPGRMFNFNHGIMADSANDRLYVASIADSSILVFDSASTADGQTSPTRWLSGSNTGLAGQSPLFVKFDSAGNLIVTCRTPRIPPSAGAIAVFAAANFVSGVTGNINVAPMRTIAGTATTLLGPHMTDYAAETDELFVGNAWTGDVVVFSAFGTATGNVAPSRILAGPATGLDIVAGAAVPRTATGVMLDLTR